jgi:hypothetical protein
MGCFFILLPSFFLPFTCSCCCCLLILLPCTFSLCNHQDSSALLQFKNSFVVNTSSKPDDIPDNMDPSCSSFSFKTESWKNGTDCCDWDGVTCDKVSGYVIGLDLSCNNLEGELHPNSNNLDLGYFE